MQNYPKIITLRLTDKQWSDLKALASDEESSMTDIVRDLIVERVDEAQKASV